jgi:hypothetical protein
MLAGFRPRLTYGNVVGTLALFIALGGTAWAVAANSVGTSQLKNSAVTSPKLANGAVTTPKLAKGAVTASKVGNKSLTGAQINAATLGTVPDASHATNSDRLGGSAPSAYQSRVGSSCTLQQFGRTLAIQKINADGSVSCQPVNVTQFLGGSIGTLSGSAIQYLAGQGLSTPTTTEKDVTVGAFTGPAIMTNLRVSVQTAPGGVLPNARSWLFILDAGGASGLRCTIAFHAKSCSDTNALAIQPGDAIDVSARPTSGPAPTRVTFSWTDLPQSSP